MSETRLVRAVILAGGKGTRLHPYTIALPKPLMPVGDMPILEIIIRQLKQAGVDDLTLSVGHLHALLRAYFADGERWGVHIDYSLETEPLGTAGPIALVDRLDETFLALNGDLLCSLDYRDLIQQHRASGAIATIASYPKEVKIQLGVLETNGNSLVDYVEKPVMNYRVSMGIYALEPKVREFISKGQPLDLPDLIKRLMAAGETVNLYNFEGYWRDIGTMEEYSIAGEEFETIRPSLGLGEPDRT